MSRDRGSSWTATGLTSMRVIALAINGASLYAASNGAIFLSKDNGLTWDTLLVASSGGSLTSIDVRDSLVVVGTYGQGVIFSKDAGVSWSPVTYKPDRIISAVGTNDQGIFAGTGEGLIFRLPGEGMDWTAIGGLAVCCPINAYVIASAGSDLIVGALRKKIVGRFVDSTWAFENSGCSNVHSLTFARNTSLLEPQVMSIGAHSQRL